ncbi:bifunctional diguanylate cyclase/phosphodiesterase [Rhodococcus sp. KRD197]|uniref:sensor domain-containing protein n=1 Tax=Rhodococcus sp. KRD197 TaxID=2729731 RepID=UPI0019D07DA7|nr:sensor domain-containing diguanylate cyclase [Rhodococcus sp. KRD197]
MHAGDDDRPAPRASSSTPTPDAGTGLSGEEGVAFPDLADRYRMLVEYTPDAICVHQHGVIVYINPSGLRYLRAQGAEQVIGHPITEFIHAESIGPMLARIGALDDGHGVASEPSEATVVAVDGSTLPMEAVSVRTSWDDRPAFQVILRDLTEHRAAQEALRYQAALVTHVSDAIIGVSPAGLITSWNPAAETVYGRTAAEVVGGDLSSAVGVVCHPAAIIAAGGRIRDTHVCADGAALAVTVSAARMDDGGHVLVCTDQTALRHAEEHFTAVVESLDEGVVVLGHTGRIASANLAAKTILDIQAGLDVSGRAYQLPFRVYGTDYQPLHPDNHPVVRARRTGRPSTAVVGIQRRRDGTRFWLSLTATLLDPGEQASSVVAAFSDITAQHEEGRELAHAATHDHLTGLPNRTFVLARLEEELSRPRSGAVAVLFIDLDHFKTINDSHGHAVGDAVLGSVARRMADALPPGSVVGRIGGDEFVAVVPNGTGVEAGALRARLASPVSVDDRTLTVAASIGLVVVEPGDTRSAQDVLNDADLEMYRSKTLYNQTT